MEPLWPLVHFNSVVILSELLLILQIELLLNLFLAYFLYLFPTFLPEWTHRGL